MHFLLAMLVECSNELKPHRKCIILTARISKEQQWLMHSFFFNFKVEINYLFTYLDNKNQS